MKGAEKRNGRNGAPVGAGAPARGFACSSAYYSNPGSSSAGKSGPSPSSSSFYHTPYPRHSQAYPSYPSAQEIAEALGGRRSGDGWICHCPAHDDKNPSLAVKDGNNGKPILYCFAGCEYSAIVEALRD